MTGGPIRTHTTTCAYLQMDREAHPRVCLARAPCMSDVEKTATVMIFVSKGYFKSINCLREVDCTVANDKHIALMHDPVKGGAPLEVIKEHECPEHLLGPIFMCPDGVTARPVITWHRIKDFQLVSLKLLTEQMLLGCATYANLVSVGLPLYLPGEISKRQLMLTKKVRSSCRSNPCASGPCACTQAATLLTATCLCLLAHQHYRWSFTRALATRARRRRRRCSSGASPSSASRSCLLPMARNRKTWPSSAASVGPWTASCTHAHALLTRAALCSRGEAATLRCYSRCPATIMHPGCHQPRGECDRDRHRPWWRRWVDIRGYVKGTAAARK